MKEKGGHFLRAYALALAVHALLFLLFAGLIRNAAVVPGGGVQPVEIQLSGPGDAGGSGGPGGSPGPARAPRPPAPAPARAVSLPAPAPTIPPKPAPTPQVPSTASPAPASSPAPSPAPAPSDLPGASDWGDTVGGPPGTGGSGGGAPGSGGSGGSGVGSGSGPPATIADIDPTPIQPISAPYPAGAKRLGQQGLVKVRADIDSQGLVVDCQVLVTSGFASLDNAALQAVRSTKFLPARKYGRTVASSIIIPVRFRLTQN